jgi:benzoyl-CoA reductase/2-hydroxyglutaryl-CoA dehydratase subunit BcrC/BadD/HgdB
MSAGAEVDVRSQRAALAALDRAYGDRLAAAREAKAAGGHVVGVVGHGAPLELISAAGALPVLISADVEHPTPRADPLMPPNHGWESRSICERALSGSFDLLDLLVVTRPYAQMYYVLKEMQRTGQAPSLPPLYLFDLVQADDPRSFAAYNHNRTDDFTARLERLTQRSVTDLTLAQAIAQTVRVRQLLGRLQALRARACLSGAAALRLIGAGFFLDSHDYSVLLERYIAAAQPDAALAARPRLLLVASAPMFHPALVQAVEDSGTLVVAEDDPWGARAAETDIDGSLPPRQALALRCARMPASVSTLSLQARRAWLLQRVQSDAIAGVVFHIPKSDRSLGWDYPSLRAALHDVSVPSCVIRDDVLQPAGRERVLSTLQPFVRELRAP